jgi:N-methylhydantoinase A
VRSRCPTGRRRVYFAGRGWVDCLCVERDVLGAGSVVNGPAIVEQLDSTTVLLPGQRGRVDRFGNLVIRARRAR